MDIKEIIQWSLKRWWWFAISVVVCAILGGVYYFTATPKYTVKATLMLRQVSDPQKKGQDEMMQLMGYSGNKLTSDEVQVLSSRDLMGRVVDALDLTTTYSKINHGRSLEIKPDEFLVQFADTLKRKVTVDVNVRKNGYKIKVKRVGKSAERFKVKNLDAPIVTKYSGDLYIAMPAFIEKGHYRAVHRTRISTIEILLQQITIDQAAKESNIITISVVTPAPRRMVATINQLLNLYNQESTVDKNLLAIQTEQFLNERIAVMEQELNRIEVSVEAYKRSQQIADLSKTADTYQQMGDSYEQQVADIEDQLQLVNYYLKKIDQPEHAYAMIPGNFKGAVNELIQDYNKHIARRNLLLQTATEQNVVVMKETELIDQKRQNVKVGLAQDLQTLTMKRDFVCSQRTQYSHRLASLPETERRYLEICREKETKEKQYVYLVEKREENALLLSSQGVPARVVETAQQDSYPTSPNLKLLAVAVLFFGMLLPLLVYFYDLFRKEFL